MKRDIDEVEFKRWFRRMIAGSGEKIEGSAMVLSIFTRHYKESPQCALELGIAALLGKPIYLLACRGTDVPAGIRRLAEGIEFYDSGDETDFKRAADRLMKIAKENLAWEGE